MIAGPLTLDLQLLPPITREMRRVLRIAATNADPLSPRRQAALAFLYAWLRVSMQCGRRNFTDFRVKRARLAYTSACLRDCWRKVA